MFNDKITHHNNTQYAPVKTYFMMNSTKVDILKTCSNISNPGKEIEWCNLKYPVTSQGFKSLHLDVIYTAELYDTDLTTEGIGVFRKKYMVVNLLVISRLLVGNLLFWNVFKMPEKKDMRYVLKIFWNVAETCRKIEDMTLYLLHI